jgi:hypothetical protein
MPWPIIRHSVAQRQPAGSISIVEDVETGSVSLKERPRKDERLVLNSIFLSHIFLSLEMELTGRWTTGR